MAVDERARHELHGRLDDVLGADAAGTLMEHLPPTGWGDVVTRDYLTAQLDSRFGEFSRGMDARFGTMNREMDARFAAVTGEMNGRFAEMDGRFAEIDIRFERVDARFAVMEARFDAVDERFSTVEAMIDSSRNEVIAAFRGELNKAVVSQSRLIIVSLFSTVAAFGGFMLALVRIAL
ncbi:hypothetical protein BH23ACT10_BH23ACT10_29670 [soil metagenome]